MNFKKGLTAVMAGAMALSLVGCGQEEEKVTATIKVWSPQEDQDETTGNWLKTMCDQFNEAHPNWDITFDYGVCSEGDAGTLIPQDASAAADVYMFANDQLGTLINANAISKLGGQAAEEVKANNTQLMIDSVTSDGDIYGVPFTGNTWFMYYDSSVFSEDDIKSLDTMLTKGKVAFPLSTAWYNASFFVANGGTLFGESGVDASAGIDFGGDKGYAVGQYLVDLVANKNFSDDAGGSGIAGLRDGSVNAFFSGSWSYSEVKEALGENFGAAQLPTITIDGEAKQLKSFAGSKAIGVNPNTENAEIAVALARYLGGADAQKAHYEMRDIIPCNTALLEDETIASDPLIKAQNDTIANTSIIQSSIAEMGQFWGPAETFGKAVVGKQVTSANVKAQIDDYVNGLNTAQ